MIRLKRPKKLFKDLMIILNEFIAVRLKHFADWRSFIPRLLRLFISIYLPITTYGSSKASPTLEEHIHWIPCGYDGSGLCWLGFKTRTAHPPSLFPIFVGSSPPTNLPVVGQANLMRRAGNHSSTCWALLGKRHKCGVTTWMCRRTRVPLFNQGGVKY